MADKPAPLLDPGTLTHMAVVVRDIEAASKAYAAMFGVDVPESLMTEPEAQAQTQYRGKKTPARAKLAFLKFGETTVELIEPVGGPSTWKAFLDTQGQGVHHLAFAVKGMDDQIKRLEANGLRLIQRGQWTDGSGGQYAYLDAVEKTGVMIELLENF